MMEIITSREGIVFNKTYMVDTCFFNKIVDGTVDLDRLLGGKYVATHVQWDEINKTKDPKRRMKLQEKFEEIIDEIIPTEVFIMGVSRLDEARLGGEDKGNKYKYIKADLDKRNNFKLNNSEDTLIAITALENKYTLLTSDYDLYWVAYHWGVDVMNEYLV